MNLRTTSYLCIECLPKAEIISRCFLRYVFLNVVRHLPTQSYKPEMSVRLSLHMSMLRELNYEISMQKVDSWLLTWNLYICAYLHCSLLATHVKPKRNAKSPIFHFFTMWTLIFECQYRLWGHPGQDVFKIRECTKWIYAFIFKHTETATQWFMMLWFWSDFV